MAATAAIASTRALVEFGMDAANYSVRGCKLLAMESLARDFRLAVRRLRMAPGFTLFAVLSLALGIGVSTAVYSAVRTLFWTPVGVPRAEEIVAITSFRSSPAMSWPDFEDLRAQQSTFGALAGSSSIRTALASSRNAEVVIGDAVSGGYFPAMGVTPLLGRLIGTSDEREAARVVVISELLWRRHFAADPSVVGEKVRLGGLPFEVVGVVKGSFHGLERFYIRSVWVPSTAIPAGPERASFSTWGAVGDRARATVAVHGRLAPGVPLERAAGEVGVIGQRLDAAYPRERQQRRNWMLRPRAADGPDLEAANTVGGMILTGVAMLLLIACSNLANLALAKGTSRSQETAVRTALGASRWRLVREQLIESSLIVIAGGALGAWLLYGLVDFLTIDLPMGFGSAMPFRPDVNAAVLSASAGSMVLAVLVFGLWPALQGTRPDVRSRLAGGAGATPPRWRLHRNLVAWQVCGCVALTLVAVMSQRVISAAGRGVPLVKGEHLAIAQVDFSLNARDQGETRRIVEELLAAVRRQPGIERVVASTGLPYQFAALRSSYSFTTPDAPFNEARDTGQSSYLIATTTGFVETLDLRLARGRAFTDRDDAAAPRVAVVTERFARRLFETTDVVGRTIVMHRTPRLSKRWPAPAALTIVGLLADPDGSAGPTMRGDSYVFLPWAQHYDSLAPVVLTARSESASAAVGVLRSTIRRVDPDLAVSLAGTGTVVLQGPIFLLRVISGLSSALATISLVLAMAGLFGVLSHVVMRRTREIGIRVALGADRARVFRLILLDGLRPVAKGVVLGLMIGAGARIAVRAWVVTQISAFEPLVFMLIPVPFVAAALLACYVPAARAARVDPNVALREL
jgi:putative ABC transport system permease protein